VKLSVLIPAYNEEKSVEAVVRRVAAVDLGGLGAPVELELIVVDDCSTDATTRAAEAAGARVVRHDVNRGEGGARNTGLEHATQEWVGTLDSDDEWLPHFLEEAWSLRDGRVLVALSTRACHDDPARDRLQGALGRRPRTLASPAAILWPENVTSASALLFRRDAALRAGGYPVGMRHAGDLDFLLRHTGHQLRLVLLTRADPVLPLYRYRLAESMTEIRMADLALSDEEASAVLASMGVALPPEAVHALNRRTRGWVTGTRFAGKFLGDQHDRDADITEFLTESDSIAEYLMGEVLAAQPPDVVDLLMTMSVPDAIEPELADALGGPGAARSLDSPARVNAFVECVPAHPDHLRFHP